MEVQRALQVRHKFVTRSPNFSPKRQIDRHTINLCIRSGRLNLTGGDGQIA